MAGNSNQAQVKRVRRSRGKIFDLDVNFLSVHRTPRHIYAQIFSPRGAAVLAAASSVEEGLRKQNLGSGKLSTAEAVGKLIAERAKANGISKVAFDRSGRKYHGRIQKLADAARANGLEF